MSRTRCNATFRYPTARPLPAIVGALAVLAVVGGAGEARAASLAEVAQRDATLHDLEFVDARHGFVVGDRGLVLRTDDGGRLWTPLETPTDGSLFGVSFVDRRNGWAVGGSGRPFSTATQGVVLRTTDGGATWTQVPTPTLPLLRWVRFFNRKEGVAVGAGEAFHPSGVFVTADGGRSWQPLPADQPRHWLAADFFTPQLGVAAAQRGALGMIARQEVKPIGATAGDRRGFHAVRVAGPTTAWLVGDGGTVMQTTDAGRTWRPTVGATPAAGDWRAVATQGEHVWVAGTPGSIVLHSADGGQTWQSQSTGVTVPLAAIEFADDRHGWAAGSLGTILATDDGGRTWRVQRRGGERLAVDTLVADRRDTPVELLVKHAAAAGYLSSVGVAFGDDAGPRIASDSARTREATLTAGGSLATVDWRLTLTANDRNLPADQLLAELNRRTDGRAAEQLQQALVLRLRTLRPAAVAVLAPKASASPGAAELLTTAIEQAVRDAANPDMLPEHRTLGLEPWRVERVVQLTPDGLRSTGGFATGNFEPQLGASVAQRASGPRRLVLDAYVSPSSRIGWRTLAGSAGAGRRDDLLAGLALARGGAARRPVATPPPGDLDQLRGVAQKRRNMQQLLARKQGDSAWVGQVVNLTGGLDPDSGAELLYQLAAGYRDAGKLDLAADTFYLLAKRYQDHPLTEPSLAWLLRYYASSESGVHAANHARNLRSQKPLANVPAGRQANLAAIGDANQTAGELSADERFERATKLGAYLRNARPLLYADPAVRFSIAAAKRRLGYEKDAERILLLMGKQAIDPAWRRCADAERWLAQPTELPPEKQVAVCKSIARRPLLDGKLTDACWTRAEPMSLRVESQASNAGDSSDFGVVRFVRDEEFVFVAIDCPIVGDPGPLAARRSRDADLANTDRVTLRIDTDRDYTTAFELSVDAQGRPHERIVGGASWADRRWDPSWYIAADQANGRWRVEVAVPVAELASPPPTPRDVWAVGVTRHTPGRAAAAAWADSDADSPDHYGLLLMR